MSGLPVSRVLAFAPSVVMQLARTRSLAEFNRIVTGLIQVCGPTVLCARMSGLGCQLGDLCLVCRSPS